MASVQIGAVVRQMSRLFGGEGTVAGLDEAGLLRRFATRRDAAALEALVARHGPMVLGVCRRVLGDSHDAEDAFQATFLVLVKKAAAIRDPNLLGPWLHGVAHRVAVRARANAAIRWSREGSGLQEAAMIGLGVGDSVDRAELRTALDDEVARLPERFRRVVVLCYLDGLTHEQAAERLRCPVGTVRSRLAAAREKLRGRLTRRGVVLSTAAFAVALSTETARASVPLALSESTLSAGMAFLSNGAGAASAGMVSAGAASLADGVTTTMFLTKIKVLGSLALAGALTLGGGAAAMQLGIGQGAKPGTTAAKGAADDTLEALIAKMRKQADVSELEKKELEVALDRARRDADRMRDEIAALKRQLRDAGRAAPAVAVNEAEEALSHRIGEHIEALMKNNHATERTPNEDDPIRRRAKQELSDAEAKVQAARATLLSAKAHVAVAEDKYSAAMKAGGNRAPAQEALDKARDDRGPVDGAEVTELNRRHRDEVVKLNQSIADLVRERDDLRAAGGAVVKNAAGRQAPVQRGGNLGAAGGMGRAMGGMGGGGMAGMMGGGGGGMGGGMGGGGMMRGGMMGGGAMSSPPGATNVGTAGDYVLIQKRGQTGIIASNPETGRTIAYAAPEGTTVMPIVTDDLVAINFMGKSIKQLAAFVPSEGKWHTIDLEVPAEERATPISAAGNVAYVIGNRVYAFSTTANVWGVAILEDGAQPNPILQEGRITVEENDRLHVFNAKTGKWSAHEAGLLVERNGKLYVFSAKTSQWTALDAGADKAARETK